MRDQPRSMQDKGNPHPLGRRTTKGDGIPPYFLAELRGKSRIKKTAQELPEQIRRSPIAMLADRRRPSAAPRPTQQQFSLVLFILFYFFIFLAFPRSLEFYFCLVLFPDFSSFFACFFRF